MNIRRTLIFRPVAAALVALLLPYGDLMPSRATSASAAIAVPSNCVQSGGAYIFQTICNGDAGSPPPAASVVANIHQFESDTLKAYLSLYNLPNSDADVAFFYQYAHTDLRVSFRSYLLMRIIDLGLTAPQTPAEADFFNWFRDRLWRHQKRMYQSAVDDKNAWQNDRCGWKPDQDVANAYGIHYIACVGTQVFNTAPTKDYFLTAARKREFDQLLVSLTPSNPAPAVMAAAAREGAALDEETGRLRSHAGVPQQDFGVSMSGPSVMLPNSDAVYTVQVTNNDTNPGFTSFSDSLPLQESLVSITASPSLAQCSGLNLVTCSITDVPAKSTVTLTMKVHVGSNATDGASIVNTATVTSPNDFTITNNSSKVTSVVSSAANTPAGFTLFNMSDTQTSVVLGTVGAVVGLPAIGVPLALANPGVRQQLLPNSTTRAALQNRINNAANAENANDAVKANAQSAKDSAAAEGDVTGENLADETIAEVTAEELGEELGEVAIDEGAGLATELAADVAAESGIAASLGPAIAIGIALIAITTVVTIVAEEADAEKSLSELDDLNNAAKVNLPDIYNMGRDEFGRYQLKVTLTELTYPDVPSSATPPADSTADASRTLVAAVEGGQPQPVSDITYKDWQGVTYTAKLYRGMWARAGVITLPASIGNIPLLPGIGNTLHVSTFHPSLYYRDWNGTQYIASRYGTNFIISKRIQDSTDVDCPASASTGVSAQTGGSCVSYVASSFQMLDSLGRHMTVSVANLPGITPPGANPYVFDTTAPFVDFPVYVTGAPTPVITTDPGFGVPPGCSLEQSPEFAGSAAVIHCFGVQGVPGQYTTRIRATNAGGSATQDYNFNVTGADINVRIQYLVSPGNAPYPNGSTWTAGVPVHDTFAVSAGGAVNFRIINGVLPTGLTFHDNGNNTATISGTPVSSVDTSGLLRIIACYGTTGVCTATDSGYSLATVPRGHLPTPPDPTQVTFTAGVLSQITLKTVGAITPVTMKGFCVNMLDGVDWMGYSPLSVDGMTISGKPPKNFGTIDLHYVRAQMDTAGLPTSQADIDCSQPNLVIAVDGRPNFFGPREVTFEPGRVGRFDLSSNLKYGFGVVELLSPLPSGLSLVPPVDDNDQWSIQGQPAPGTGRDYSVTAKGTAGSNSTTQTFLLHVNEAPSLNLPGVINVMSTAPASFTLRPDGYPRLGAMKITRIGKLPPGLTFSNATSLVDEAGTATIGGTPFLNIGNTDWPVSFQLDNGALGSPVTVSTTFHVLPAGDVTHDNAVNCSDISLVKGALNSKRGDVKFNVDADVNGDGIINVLDLSFVTTKLAPGTKCQ